MSFVCGCDASVDLPKFESALASILAVHRRVTVVRFVDGVQRNFDGCAVCTEAGRAVRFPCETVRAIDDAMGFSSDGVDVSSAENTIVDDSILNDSDPFGPCGHTKYVGCPPCVHDAYQRGREDAAKTIQELMIAHPFVFPTDTATVEATVAAARGGRVWERKDAVDGIVAFIRQQAKRYEEDLNEKAIADRQKRLHAWHQDPGLVNQP